MTSSRSRAPFWLTLAGLAPFAFCGGFVAQHSAGAASGVAYKQLDLFARVLSYVENNYVERVDSTQLVHGAVKGMLDTLDPHTLFMPPDVFREMKIDTTGEFGGLGLEVAEKSEVLTVVTPLDDTPAFRAGIKPGDQLLAIDGESTKELGMAGAIRKMRGPPGSRCTLQVMRSSFKEPRDIVVLRDRIRVTSVEGELVKGFGHVRIKNFQDRTDRQLRAALDELRKRAGGELPGLVLDLRNNPGGLLDQAVRIADRFLPAGKLIVSTRGRGGGHVEEERSHDRDTEADYPLVVLVNGGSASASEIVAGALQDNARATVVGSQTFGKGSVQTIIELEDGSGLKLTIARYYTPKGRSIQELGISPDVVVKDASDEGALREVDLKRHFKNERAPAGKGAANDAPAGAGDASAAAAAEGEDRALAAAIEQLQSLRAAKSAPAPAPAPAKP